MCSYHAPGHLAVESFFHVALELNLLHVHENGRNFPVSRSYTDTVPIFFFGRGGEGGGGYRVILSLQYPGNGGVTA